MSREHPVALRLREPVATVCTVGEFIQTLSLDDIVIRQFFAS
jgi:hypothetical protein